MSETRPGRIEMWAAFARVVGDFDRYRGLVAAAQNARTREEHVRSVAALETLHAEGKKTSRSMALLGVLYVYLERDAEACAQLDALRGGFRDAGFDAAVWINHAIALERVGRVGEAADGLRRRLQARWPAPSQEKARRLLDALEGVVADDSSDSSDASDV